MRITASLLFLLTSVLSAQTVNPFETISETGSVLHTLPSRTVVRSLPAGATCSLYAPQQAGTAVYASIVGSGQLIDHGGFELPNVGFQQIYYNSSVANSPSTSLGYPTVSSQLASFASLFADNRNWSGAATDDYTLIQQYGTQTSIANSVFNNPSNLVTPGQPYVDNQPAIARINDKSIQTYLVSLFASGKVKAQSNVVYGLYFPSGTGIVSGLSQSCSSFCGYHSHFAYGTVQVPYAVFPYPDCTGCAVSGLSAADVLTIVTGHELRESVTDPGTLNFGSWFDNSGAEADDKCAWCNLYQTTVGRFWVQPEFSNGGTVTASGFSATYPQLSPGVGGCVVPNNSTQAPGASVPLPE
jgi:hypothetical protein